MDRMRELIDILNKAAKSYYQLSREIMTDREYDTLYDELVALEEKTGIVLSDSPTQKVGFEVLSSLTKVRHEKRMLSLDKTKDTQKLKSFLGDKEGVLSWKMDGLTIVLKYEDGILKQAITRGSGEIGEDITHNARVFKNVPLMIKEKAPVTVRGEGIITFRDFEKINETLADEDKYKNPRNLCSGSVRQLNSEIAAKRNIHFYAFALVEGGEHKLRTEQLDFLKGLGFKVVEHDIVTAENIEKTVREYEARIEKNEFASDGLVLSLNDIEYGKSLGETSKFPRDSIAFKWADEMAETTLTEIIWNTSRTGLINPIAVFESVELEGTTVNRASVHNVSILKELALGIGDRIKVYKANMIIPQIAENLTKSGNAPIPDKCAVCGGETEIRSLREGEALYCTNPNCKAQLVRSISHFCSRDAMNIEGVSEETIRKFVDEGFIENYTDMFTLESHGEKIMAMEGFGEKSFGNLVASVKRSSDVHMYNFIYALGINHVGLSNAKLLCKNFDFDFERITKATEEELLEIDGFGAVIAHSLNSYFANAENMNLLEKALGFISFAAEEVNTDAESLSGKTFVVTGDVFEYKNRKELQKDIELRGGKVTGSVSKNTDYLINNDAHSASSKNKKAKELGIPVITEKEFIEMFIK
ncbi:MAG: NAD-dependent DNA ligase LigA [Lachnospiraceae bacterium]|nr:NAD-dependent DNA ligase LigA [Lachnospiraceae bacterium]